MRDSNPMEEIVEYLKSGHRAFKRERVRFRFEGMPSRASFLTTSREREVAVSAIQNFSGTFSDPVDVQHLCFCRLKAGEYLLPMAWAPMPEFQSLQFLILTDAPSDALIISTEAGAESVELVAGRTLTVRETCRFWLGPLLAEEVFIAISGLRTDEVEGELN